MQDIPKKIIIHIGKSCNLNCRWCHEHRKPIDYNFDELFSEWKQRIKQIKPNTVTVSENMKSDPMSEPQLHELFQFLEKLKFITKYVILINGMYDLPETWKGLKKLQFGISIDGPKDVHEFNRGIGTFDVAWDFFLLVNSHFRNTWVNTIVY